MHKTIALGLLATITAAQIAQAETPQRVVGISSATAQSIAYGSDSLQRLQYWRAQGMREAAPLVVFVHGGGWKRGSMDNATGRWKASHYPAEGYGSATINYRLVTDATVEQQAQDVALALNALLDRAGQLGIDRSRVVLMGHSAGAHLVALVGTDERYLKAVGLSFDDVAGVIPLDGAAYDVPAQMADGPQIMQATYRQAFGMNPARQRRLSPTLNADAPNAPRFLILHVQRADGIRQSEELAKVLKAAGIDTQIASLPGQGLKGHMEINRKLGDPAYEGTAIVDRWLKEVFAR